MQGFSSLKSLGEKRGNFFFYYFFFKELQNQHYLNGPIQLTHLQNQTAPLHQYTDEHTTTVPALHLCITHSIRYDFL